MGSSSTASESSSATCYDLGEDGIIVRLSIAPSTDDNAPRSKAIMKTIVVLDVSGSMGFSVGAIVQLVLPSVFRDIGLSEDEPIQIVAFESNTQLYNYTVGSLATSTLHARGGTNMRPAIQMVGNMLGSNPSIPYRIIVVSDGQIGDKQQTLLLASQLESQLVAASRNAPTQVCLIRALTSTYADPDTAALACLGQLNTGGSSAPKDCPIQSVDKGQIEAMKKTILESLNELGSSIRIRSVCCSNASVLMRLPGAPTLATLQVPDGETFVLLAPGTDASQLSVDGQPIRVEQANLTSEDSILPLLLYLEAQVRQLMVIGKAEVRVKQLLDWVGRISHRICKPEGEDSASPSIIARRNRLLQAISQRTRSVVGRLRALANMDAVSSLNSTRQAEFLRGVGAGSQGRALARRAAKVDSGNIDEVVRAEVVALRGRVVNNPIPEKPREDPVSFYGHDTLPGVLNSLADVPEDDLYELDARDILQFVGPLGFTYFANFQNDCPEPWSCFRLNQIFLGDSTYLNSADLWTSRIQSGQGSTALLMAPGTQTRITGVIPVRHLSPEAYDILQQLAPTLLNLQVAASLRGALVCMPGDLPAVVTAGAVNLASILASNPTEAGAVALWALLNDLNNLRQTKTIGITTEMSRFLALDDPRPYLAGDLFISSGLKPLAAILAGCVQPTPQLARAILGFGLYLAAGKKFKDPQERKDALNTFLAIDPKNDVDPGAPGTPDPVNPVFCHSYDRSLLHQLGGLVPEFNVETIAAVVVAAKAFAKGCLSVKAFLETFKELWEQSRSHDLKIFGTSSEEETQDMAGALALQALLSPNQESRISIDAADPNNRKYKFPDLNGSVQVAQFVGDEVATIYAERYKKALKVKRDEEEAEKCKQLILQLVGASTTAEFISILVPKEEAGTGSGVVMIKDRSSPGYPKLLEALMNLTSKVPNRLEKLWVLILGRDRDGNPVWCSGNTFRGDYKPFVAVFEAAGEEGKALWLELKTVKDKFGGHRYRESGVANRHGHSNAFPSWWALGFESPDAFKAADPEAFEKYVQERKRIGRLASWMKK